MIHVENPINFRYLSGSLLNTQFLLMLIFAVMGFAVSVILSAITWRRNVNTRNNNNEWFSLESEKRGKLDNQSNDELFKNGKVFYLLRFLKILYLHETTVWGRTKAWKSFELWKIKKPASWTHPAMNDKEKLFHRYAPQGRRMGTEKMFQGFHRNDPIKFFHFSRGFFRWKWNLWWINEVENLRVLAAGEAFGVEKFAEMRLLCWTVDLKARPLPHVEMSLLHCLLELLVSSCYFRHDGLLDFKSRVRLFLW